MSQIIEQIVIDEHLEEIAAILIVEHLFYTLYIATNNWTPGIFSTALCPGYNQGGHWRCDYVTDQVFQEKSYKTNHHLFSVYAGVLWRSVKSIIALEKAFFLREGHIWWLLYPFSSLRRFISNSPIVLHHGWIWRTVCSSLNDSNDSLKEVDLNF